tara:strand:- start:2470 stop:2652 length:183 start_codon:yes stop_codon:yes gene_type:complete
VISRTAVGAGGGDLGDADRTFGDRAVLASELGGAVLALLVVGCHCLVIGILPKSILLAVY